MRIFILFILLSPLAVFASDSMERALQEAAKEVTLKVQFEGYRKVAVVNFTTHKGEENELGDIVAEEFTFALIDQAFGFEVMDRNHLAPIFEEYKLAMGGLVDEATLIEIGKLQSVEALVIGSVTRMDEHYKSTIKVLSTETASIVAAAKCSFTATPALDDYYGYEAKVIPTTPKRHLTCEEKEEAILHVENRSSSKVFCRLTSSPGSYCKGTVEFFIDPGMRAKSPSICSGVVHYEILDSYTGKPIAKGSVFVQSCGEKVVSWGR